MSKSVALERLQEIHIDTERVVTLAQHDALQRRDDAQARLRELEQYLAEYRASFADHIAQGRSARYAQDHLAFTARLDAAIVVQRARLLACERDCEQAQVQRLTAARELRTIEQLLARRRAVSAAKESTRERREIDDRIAAQVGQVDV